MTILLIEDCGPTVIYNKNCADLQRFRVGHMIADKSTPFVPRREESALPKTPPSLPPIRQSVFVLLLCLASELSMSRLISIHKHTPNEQHDVQNDAVSAQRLVAPRDRIAVLAHMPSLLSSLFVDVVFKSPLGLFSVNSSWCSAIWRWCAIMMIPVCHAGQHFHEMLLDLSPEVGPSHERYTIWYRSVQQPKPHVFTWVILCCELVSTPPNIQDDEKLLLGLLEEVQGNPGLAPTLTDIYNLYQ